MIEAFFRLFCCSLHAAVVYLCIAYYAMSTVYMMSNHAHVAYMTWYGFLVYVLLYYYYGK